MSDEPPPPPAGPSRTFWVSAQLGFFNWHGGARLHVEPGRLQVVPDRMFGPLLAHGPVEKLGHDVLVVIQHLAPPWMNTTVVLGALDHASVPMWRRRRLLAALEAAGFKVAVVRRWTPVGMFGTRP